MAFLGRELACHRHLYPSRVRVERLGRDHGQNRCPLWAYHLHHTYALDHFLGKCALNPEGPRLVSSLASRLAEEALRVRPA